MWVDNRWLILILGDQVAHHHWCHIWIHILDWCFWTSWTYLHRCFPLFHLLEELELFVELSLDCRGLREKLLWREFIRWTLEGVLWHGHLEIIFLLEARIRSSQHHGGSVADAPLDDVHAQDFIEDDIIRHVVMSLHSPVVLLLAFI